MKKHAETRWVSMKYVALRCLEQWKNLKEYFLKFLPKQKNFKREVEKTQRYLRIKTALSDNITEAYVSFVAFVAHDFQEFLVPFQSTEPMIHLLCPSLCKLMSTLQRKFVKKSKLSDDITKNVYINVSEDRNIKPMSHLGQRLKYCFQGIRLWPLLKRNLIESATAKLKVGNERKRKFEDDLCKLERKRKKMISSK